MSSFLAAAQNHGRDTAANDVDMDFISRIASGQRLFSSASPVAPEPLSRQASQPPPPPPPGVWLSQEDYDKLLSISDQYVNLRTNLIRGGVNDQTLDLLTRKPALQRQPKEENGGALLNQDSVSVGGASFTTPVQPQPGMIPRRFDGMRRDFIHVDRSDSDDDESLGQSAPDVADIPSPPTEVEVDACKPRLVEREAMRTIQLLNLPDRCTHADITSEIRGGQLVDVFVRSREKAASVSFVYSDDAIAFYNHARKNDLYIRQKRVDIEWNERQYILSPYLANKISNGTSRNIVINQCGSFHTEDSIREDLDHIHNLVVVKITFIGNACYISTNSVTSAMYARTCMSSRQKYKQSRIEFDLDECAQSLARLPGRQPSATLRQQIKRPLNPNANRFELLTLGDS